MAIHSREVTEAALSKCDHGKVIDTNNWRRAVQAYLASIHFADTCIGRVIDALDKSRYAENTIIVLWGDHGWHLGEKLISGKNSLWDRSTRVPLVFAGPGITTGQRCTRPAELLDIYPTLVELCGLRPPPAARFDGHGAGWVVYGPGSAHSPTVTGGRALVLYLLPQGAIEFTPPA